MTLKQTQEEELKRYHESELRNRILLIESIAQVHGAGEYTGQTIQQFLLSAMEASAKGAIENVIENAGELFEQWQGDGYVDRTSVIKQQLSTKAKDYMEGL